MIVKRLIRTIIMTVVSVAVGVLAGPFITPFIENTLLPNGSDAFTFLFGGASLLGTVAVAMLVGAAIRGVFWTDDANTAAKLLASRAAMVALLFNVVLGMMLTLVGFGSALGTYVLCFATSTFLVLILPDWFLKGKSG